VTGSIKRPRYAVYFALPRDSRLWQAAQAWLGRDCESGAALERPVLNGWSAADLAEVTSSPRHYGFHGTLKAPFELATGKTLADLQEAVRCFGATQPAFTAPPLKIAAIGPFLALTLSTPCPALQALAAAAVTELDPLRAPLGEADLARRLRSDLTGRQRELLLTWGYPYVLEEFRFHMTLTGPIADATRRDDLRDRLAERFRPLLAQPVPVSEICLYSQDRRESPFLLRRRFRLAGKTTPESDQTPKNETRPAT
jgi:putative phosphonate metabolism protein